MMTKEVRDAFDSLLTSTNVHSWIKVDDYLLSLEDKGSEEEGQDQKYDFGVVTCPYCGSRLRTLIKVNQTQEPGTTIRVKVTCKGEVLAMPQDTPCGRQVLVELHWLRPVIKAIAPFER